MKTCVNHPEVKALSSCNQCRQPYCADCLVEGGEYYYCRQNECQAEMIRTGDVLPSTEPEAEAETQLITIASYSQPYQAEIAKAHLEAEGIPAFLSDEYLVSINWLYSNAVGGVRLQVAETDVETARVILSTDLSENAEEAEPGENQEPG